MSIPTPVNPLHIVKILANESQYGLCPKLSKVIRPLSELIDGEMDKSVASEEAVSLEINNQIISKIEGYNLSTDSPPYIGEDIDGNMQFKPLIFKNNISPKKHINDIELISVVKDYPGKHVIYANNTINGGTFKQVKMISYSDFLDDVYRAIPLLDNFNNNMILGKIEIEIIQPFSYSISLSDEGEDRESCLSLQDDPTDVQSHFSIGTNLSNKDNIIKGFIVTNRNNYVIPITYGEVYNAKCGIINSIPKLYKNLAKVDSEGLMKVTIYYDDLSNRSTKTGFVFGGRNSNSFINEIESLNLEHMTPAIIESKLLEPRVNGGICVDANNIIYLVGGAIAENRNCQFPNYNMTNTLELYNVNTQVIDVSSISFPVFEPKMGFGISQYRQDFVFLFGGFTSYTENVDYQLTNKIERFSFINSSSSILNQTLPINLGNTTATTAFLYDNITYLINGRIDEGIPSGISSFTNNIHKFKLANSISDLSIAKTLNYSDSPLAMPTIDKIYIGGGVSEYNKTSDDFGSLLFQIEELNIANDTLSSKIQINMTIGRGFGSMMSSDNNEKIYFVGGGDINLNNPRHTNYIDMFNTITDTDCIVDRTYLTESRAGHQGVSI